MPRRASLFQSGSERFARTCAPPNLRIVAKNAIAFIATLSTFSHRYPLKPLKLFTQALAGLLQFVTGGADDPGYFRTLSVLLL